MASYPQRYLSEHSRSQLCTYTSAHKTLLVVWIQNWQGCFIGMKCYLYLLIRLNITLYLLHMNQKKSISTQLEAMQRAISCGIKRFTIEL